MYLAYLTRFMGALSEQELVQDYQYSLLQFTSEWI